jgi:hypothetical protein
MTIILAIIFESHWRHSMILITPLGIVKFVFDDKPKYPFYRTDILIDSIRPVYVTGISTSDLCPVFKFSNLLPFLTFSNRRNWHLFQMTSHPFEAMMEKWQDQIPDEGFLMTKKRHYILMILKNEKMLKKKPKNKNKIKFK